MNERLMDALDYVDERWLAELERPAPRRLPRRTAWLIAAVLAALFTVGAAAAGVFSLDGWFDRRWEEQTGHGMSAGQEEILAGISQKLELSAVDNGLQVAAEEITVGQNGVTVLFAVRLEEGKLQEDLLYSFDPMLVEAAMEPIDSVYSYGFDFAGFDESEGVAYIVFEYSGFDEEKLQSGRYLHLSLCDLVSCTKSNAPLETVVEGRWEFSLPLTTPAEPTLVLGDAEVTAADDQGDALTLRLRNLRLSSTALRLWYDVEQNYDLPLAELIFSDGSALRCLTASGHRNEEEQRFEMAYEWAAPVDLDQVTAIRFGEDIIPVE